MILINACKNEFPRVFIQRQNEVMDTLVKNKLEFFLQSRGEMSTVQFGVKYSANEINFKP